jgi:hypothetical protein
MAAERRRDARERRPAIWPWLLMPLIVLLVFCALLRMHHPRGWAGAWTHSDESAPPTR